MGWGSLLSVKNDAKKAVLTAYNATKSVWIEIFILDADKAHYDPYKDYKKNAYTEHSLMALPTTNSTKYLKGGDGHRVKTIEREFIANPDDITVDFSLIDQVRVGSLIFKVEEINLVDEDVLVKFKLRAQG